MTIHLFVVLGYLFSFGLFRLWSVTFGLDWRLLPVAVLVWVAVLFFGAKFARKLHGRRPCRGAEATAFFVGAACIFVLGSEMKGALVEERTRGVFGEHGEFVAEFIHEESLYDIKPSNTPVELSAKSEDEAFKGLSAQQGSGVLHITETKSLKGTDTQPRTIPVEGPNEGSLPSSVKHRSSLLSSDRQVTLRATLVYEHPPDDPVWVRGRLKMPVAFAKVAPEGGGYRVYHQDWFSEPFSVLFVPEPWMEHGEEIKNTPDLVIWSMLLTLLTGVLMAVLLLREGVELDTLAE